MNRKIAKTVAKTYRRTLRRSVSMTTLECWYAGIDVESVLAEIGPMWTSR